MKHIPCNLQILLSYLDDSIYDFYNFDNDDEFQQLFDKKSSDCSFNELIQIKKSALTLEDNDVGKHFMKNALSCCESQLNIRFSLY